MDSQYLDCYVSIYAHASDLEQDVVLSVYDSFVTVTIKNTFWRWSNKLQQILFENTVFLKRLAALQILGSNLLHSITMDEKKFFFWKSYV